jgi:hypothetical protein
MRMALLHVGLTMALWVGWHFFMIPHLAVPIQNILNQGGTSGVFNPQTLIAVFMMIYLPTLLFSKAGGAFKDISNPILREITSALFKASPFFLVVNLISFILGFKFLLLVSFLSTFLIFVPLSYFSFYYQVQGVIGDIYGRHIGLGRYVSTENFAGKLAQTKARWLQLVSYLDKEAAWKRIWHAIVMRIHYEDKISIEAGSVVEIAKLKNLGQISAEEIKQELKKALDTLSNTVDFALEGGEILAKLKKTIYKEFNVDTSERIE